MGKKWFGDVFRGQWTTDSDSAPQETPLNICRLVICHCEFNRGQWPQVTLVDLDPHLAQCQGSHPVMYWHQSHQLSPFKSIAPRQVAFTHDFAEILRRLFLLWRHNFVNWPDPTKFFSPKVAQRMPHKLWKISARSSKRCGVQFRKTHGGVASTPPDRARVKWPSLALESRWGHHNFRSPPGPPSLAGSPLPWSSPGSATDLSRAQPA